MTDHHNRSSFCRWPVPDIFWRTRGCAPVFGVAARRMWSSCKISLHLVYHTEDRLVVNRLWAGLYGSIEL